MKKIKSMVSIFAMLTMMAGLSGCASQDDMDDMVPEDNGGSATVHYARMILDGTRESFGDTRAAAGWEDGDKLYLQFSVGGQKVNGQAVYKAGDDEWDVQYYGTITKGVESACEAYFFDGAVSATSSEVVLDTHTGVYQDKSATYLLKDGVIRVTATLSPATGRFRFKGAANTKYNASGFKSYTRYNISTNAFQVASVDASESIGADGYSAYYYGYFEDEGNKVLTVTDKDNWMQYTKVMDGNALKQGHSGSLKLPVNDSHSGWVTTMLSSMTFSANGVSFKMIRVEGGTFTMGATAEQFNGYTPDDSERPKHSVTLSSYAIAETEVTQALWREVMGYIEWWSSEYGLGDNYPAYYISYEDVQSFLTELNSLTGQKFRMPTEAEWEFAARGGNKSKGYIFAGSNTVGNVAWCFDWDDSNNNKSHPVKTKAANELGIYDMSGNVGELCSDWFGTYSSSAQTDPTGPATGTYRVARGGCWQNDASNCRCAYRCGLNPGWTYNDTGFRLAL